MASSLGVRRMRRLAWTWHWRELSTGLLVDAETAAMLRRNRQRYFQRERGGQLFAELSSGEGIWLVASPPHPADSAGVSWLEYDHARCRSEIATANRKGLRLIGYWHTHPQRIPRFSSRDCASFRAFSEAHCLTLPHPVAVIVGRSTRDQGIRAWSVRKSALAEASLIPFSA